jgi:hypothetical protein
MNATAKKKIFSRVVLACVIFGAFIVMFAAPLLYLVTNVG